MPYARFTLRWRRATDFRDIPDHVIYVFGKANNPFYIGKAAHFGRRYTYGYHHLITAFLQVGGFLFYAHVPRWDLVLAFERALIRQWKPRFNKSKLVCDYTYSGTKPWMKALISDAARKAMSGRKPVATGAARSLHGR